MMWKFYFSRKMVIYKSESRWREVKKDFRVFVLVLALAAFLAVAFLVKNGALAAVNASAASLAQKHRNPAVTAIMIAASAAGEWFTYLPVIIFLLVFKRTKKAGLKSGAAVAVSAALNEALKAVFKIDRPSGEWLVKERGYGFPSGHAMNAAVFAISLAFFILRDVKVKGTKIIVGLLAAAFVLLVGFSRIYLGVHTFADLMGGYLFGVFFASLVTLLTDRFEKKREKDKV